MEKSKQKTDYETWGKHKKKPQLAASYTLFVTELKVLLLRTDPLWAAPEWECGWCIMAKVKQKSVCNNNHKLSGGAFKEKLHICLPVSSPTFKVLFATVIHMSVLETAGSFYQRAGHQTFRFAAFFLMCTVTFLPCRM